MDLLFERDVSARKFKETEVNVFAEDVNNDVLDNYEKQKETKRAKTVFV